MNKIHGSEVLVINALRKTPHMSHFTLDEALELIESIGPKRAYLTHLSHLMGKHEDIQKELPENVFVAYDGLKIQI
jgi:phosphoribosyl 1,2-cyclic phosphate phosphodiesterase